jgi:hypothetical protein
MQNLSEGVYFSTEDMTRDKYNELCQTLIAAGAPEGEYIELPNDFPLSEYGNTECGGVGKHSNIFGDFNYFGWMEHGIYHSDGVEFYREDGLQNV